MMASKDKPIGGIPSKAMPSSSSSSSLAPLPESLFAEVRGHFRSARSQALSYLLTVGAKAIVLATTTQDRVVMFRGLDEELAAKENMRREEDVRRLRRQLADKQGITVVKRARNSVVRRINLRIRTHNGISCLQWRAHSFPYLKKYFPFVPLVDAAVVNRHRGQVINFRGSDLDKWPFWCVRVKNADRELDIGFESIRDADAFVILLLSQWFGKDLSESQSYKSEETSQSGAIP